MPITPSEQPDLLDELIMQASLIARERLAAPDSAARLRQLNSNEMSEIQRLEASPMALDQLLAVAYRLAGSRPVRGDITDHLRIHMENAPSSLEIEAQRRGIWKLNRTEPLPIVNAELAAARIMQLLESQDRDMATHLPLWAALYADLWCDPRIGASSDARRTMLLMVTLLHERGVAAGGRALAGELDS
ncbi:MAG: hypothetical protein EOP21_00895 [Hyphomicrobiales bacterium]|nr:MAG: hypothetical protein EOP21_00895 [Hyphomicrobiales bacterium]